MLSACANLPTVGPDHALPVVKIAPQWQQALPHGGKLDALSDWWRQFDDPIISTLVDAAQTESASLSAAAARVEQARAVAVASGAGALPSLDLTASGSRAAFTFGGPVALRTQQQLQLLSNWEIDLFGGQRRDREASTARLQARSADWHDARISVAAETAIQYLDYRHCEQHVKLLQQELGSRQVSAQAMRQLAQAGFQPQASADLAAAALADAQQRVTQMQGGCKQRLLALNVLTGMTTDALTTLLASREAQLPQAPAFALEPVPAQVLVQRPDVAAAERDLAAANADVGVAEAARMPRLALSGAIGPLRLESGGLMVSATTWSLGPSISLPIFDGGRRTAQRDAAIAQHTAAAAAFKAKTRQAVRDVEEALTQLASLQAREPELAKATDGFQRSLQAAQTRQTHGFASVLDLEDARRQALAAQTQLLQWQRDRTASWIALYRAAGGGWKPDLGLATTGSSAGHANANPKPQPSL